MLLPAAPGKFSSACMEQAVMPFLSLDPRMRSTDSLAEWSKALAPGASPKGRGFEPHSCHFHIFGIRCESGLPFMTACGAIGRNGQQ